MVDMAQLRIVCDFTESDVSSVKVGQSAAVVFPAVTSAADPAGLIVTGTVSEIDLTSTVSSNVVSYGATITLHDVPGNVKLGQTGNVTVTTASKPNVLYVPTTALSTVAGTTTVTVQNGKTTKTVPVTTGVAGNSSTEITSGLSQGQTIVLPTTTTSTVSSGIPGAGGGR
jgi:multidrug efflux pump subunit AcrA (membrane-fusion protein)